MDKKQATSNFVGDDPLQLLGIAVLALHLSHTRAQHSDA